MLSPVGKRMNCLSVSANYRVEKESPTVPQNKTAKRMTTAMRRLFAEPKLTQIPGVIDAAWARVVAAEGFDAVYMTGAGTSA